MFARNLLKSIARTMSTPSKIDKRSLYIATHDNTFHCDDVTACYILKSLSRFRDHDIVRTRLPDILDGAEIVVDVGDVFDATRLRLDHHQRSFNQTIKDFHPKMKTTNPDKAVRLSSAGLVYAIFGKDYIVKQLNLGETYSDVEKDNDKKHMVDVIYEAVYVGFMEEIDAIDNGVDIAAGDNVVYNYHINTGLSTRVGYYNPIGDDVTPELRLEQFKKAMDMVGIELSQRVKFYGQIWWPKRQAFRECVLKRKDFDSSGQLVMIGTEHLAGWKSSIGDIEEELGIVGELKFVIYNDGSTASPWRATAVPKEAKSFINRFSLKEEWRGKRGEELQQISGISDATFVHMGGFTGGALSEAGIKKMVRVTLGLE